MGKRDKSTRKEPQYNVACPNFMKVSASIGCGGLQSEMEDRLGENTPNIDSERTEKNLYFLPDPLDRKKFIYGKEKPQVSLQERVMSRINEVGAVVKKDKNTSSEPGRKKNPRDSIIMENIIFQISHERAMEILKEDDMLDENGKIRMDKEFTEDMKTLQMFLDSYQFAMDRYGAENVIGAYLHFDEYTPHMHLQVVPIEMRQAKYGGELLCNSDGSPKMKGFLNNKELFGPEEYKSIWPSYAEALKEYGVVAAEGLVPKGEYEKQATMDAVRQRENEAKENIKILESQGNEIRSENEKLKGENTQLQDAQSKLNEQKQLLEKGISDLGFDQQILEHTYDKLSQDYDYLSATNTHLASENERLTEANTGLKNDISQRQITNFNLQDENVKIYREIGQRSFEVGELERKIKELQKDLEGYEKRVKLFSEEVQLPESGLFGKIDWKEAKKLIEQADALRKNAEYKQERTEETNERLRAQLRDYDKYHSVYYDLDKLKERLNYLEYDQRVNVKKEFLERCIPSFTFKQIIYENRPEEHSDVFIGQNRYGQKKSFMFYDNGNIDIIDGTVANDANGYRENFQNDIPREIEQSTSKELFAECISAILAADLGRSQERDPRELKKKKNQGMGMGR